MIGFIRKRVTYANVAATIAIFFALSGGAYAASKYLITSTKQISPKVLKALKGKNGKNGADGAAGPAGSTGKEGSAGKNGANGEKGASGTSATAESFTGKAHGCEEGGVIVKSASPEAVVCNGKAGANGTTGFTETLPEGKTEKGTWEFGFGAVEGAVKAGGEPATSTHPPFGAPISFPIPLAEPLGKTQVHYLKYGATDAACGGEVEEPTAAPGNLCVYEREVSGLNTEPELEEYQGKIVPPGSNEPTFTPDSEGGAGRTGALVGFIVGAEVSSSGWGTWAVTAPEG